jgi:uncharacterized protein with von Willebrand factor type A (vWA) domain
METRTELIRLASEQPLTLKCSALADFLWQDFVRDSRPVVTYLIEKYKITQISRFGKELFERLYSGDCVEWLVTEQAFEDYFRAACDGESVTYPEGYKPENALWYTLMASLSEAVAWPTLVQISLGEQFNAGNNAVNLLNQLSKLIEEVIENNTLEVSVLVNAGEELESIREQFKKAISEGNADKARQLRAKGKEINQKINDALQQVEVTFKGNAHEMVDRAVKESQELSNAYNNLFGSKEAEGKKVTDLEEKRDLAKKLKHNRDLKKIVTKLGALKRVWAERKRAKKTKSNYEEVKGVLFSNDIIRSIPTELALASDKKGRALFALKYTQKTLLTKDYSAHRKDLGKGPIVMYIDSSGSMLGQLELWSKAIAFVIAEEALRENRDIEIHLFDTRINGSVVLNKSRKNNKELLDFVGAWTLGGGTAFNAVLSHALASDFIKGDADVVLITDGESEVNPNLVKQLDKVKSNKKIQWSTICLNDSTPPVCKTFSDFLYAADINDDTKTIDILQECFK